MIHYFIEVTIAWTLFYSIYGLLLKKETFFNVNRWYLLNTLWIGALIPFLRKLPVHFQNAEAIMLEPVAYINYGTHFISESVSTQAETSSINYEFLIGTLYICGVLFFALKMSMGLLRIWRIYTKGKKQPLEDVTLVISEDFHLPFSFLNKVFLHESFLENDSIKEILDHELKHIKSRHTYDVLFTEIMSILFWWNPLIYIYKKSIKQTHEYAADAYAAQHSHRKNYGRILLGQSSSGIELALTNQFFNSHLKKRIIMLYTEKSARHKLSRYLLVLPLFLFLSVLFSFDTDDHNYSDSSEDEGLRIMLMHDSKTLEVGETYSFKVLNFHKSQGELSLDINPSIGGIGLFNETEDLDNIYQFTFSPERATENGEPLIITVKHHGQAASIELNIIGDPIVEVPEEVEEVEWLYFHNGIEMTEKPEGDITCDGEIRMTSGSADIKRAYNIDVNENVKIMDFIGNITFNKTLLKADAIVRKLSGRITDDKGSPLIGTTVVVKDTDVGTVTDVKGHFNLDIPEGHNTIIVSYVGYATREVELKNQSELNISLSPEESEIFKVVEEMPRFPGCEGTGTETEIKKCADEKFKKYIYENLEYPKQAKENKIEGKVFLQYIISETGRVKDAVVIRDIGAGCGAAALEVVESMNNMDQKWIPGRQKGKPVSVLFTLPVEFKLGNDSEEPSTEQNEEEIFKVVEEMPRFPGCEDQGLTKDNRSECSMEAMLRYLYSNLKYPAEARKQGVQGKVYLQFIVRKDGKLSDVNVVREIGGGCGDAALEVVKNMPDWIPGKQRGKAVDVLFTLPIAFNLGGNTKARKKKVKNKDQGSVDINKTESTKDCVDPIIIVDGKRYDKNINDVNPDNIESVNVFKNNVPDKYLQYKNDCGIIEIVLKNAIKTESIDINKSNDKAQAEIELTSPKENKMDAVAPEFILKPNPAQDMINVSLDDNSTIDEVLIIDMSGQNVKKIAINNKNGEIDVSDLASGSYILSTQSLNGQVLKKFVINR
jgi:TonB family protein